MPPQNNDQFYFLNQTAAPKKSPLSILPSNGNSFKSRMLLVVGGAIIVIIILIIVFSILGNLGKGNNSKLVSVLENQSIVMDIANQGIKNSNDQPTVDLSTTIDNVLTSDQNTYINTLIINGIKPTKNQLAVKNIIIDKNITIALGNGTLYPMEGVAMVRCEEGEPASDACHWRVASLFAFSPMWLRQASMGICGEGVVLVILLPNSSTVCPY
jgi:hypothetical protein